MTSATTELGTSFDGDLIRPTDTGYDEARRVWNGMIDRRPELIARCTSVQDVVAAVHAARDSGLVLAVRGGGHSVAGNGVCDGGIVIDLSGLRSVEVDPVMGTARVQGGALLQDLDRATQRHGLATTGGLVSTTGVGGFTLGGGLGWLARKHGTACDNVLSAEVVTASGEVVTASESENAELFWGLRGGGGNFGIVTSFTYRLHRVGPDVLAGVIVHRYDHAPDVLRFVREFAAVAPDDLTVIAIVLKPGDAPFMPADRRNEPALVLAVCHAGALDAGERALAPLRGFGTPLADTVAPTPYVDLQCGSDDAFPHGIQNYWKSSYLTELTDDGITTFLTSAAEMPSAATWVYLQQLGGAISRADPSATAFSHRDAAFDFSILAKWADPADTEANIGWARDFWSAMQAHSAAGVYVNNLGSEGDDRIRAAFGPYAFERLTQLKRRYDPDNLFRMNQNIRPE